MNVPTNNNSKIPAELKKPKGKILRVKHGYNPNSSSMGSLIFALPTTLFAATAGFSIVSSLILSFFLKNPATRSSEEMETDEEAPVQ